MFIELRHWRRIAFTGSGVAVLMGLSMFSSIAHADEASLEDLVADPTARIIAVNLKFDNFHLLRFPDDPSLHVEVTGGFLPNGEVGIRFTDDYDPDRSDLISFTVTSYSVILLTDMMISFDANPLNPDVDTGSAWVSAIASQASPFPWSHSVMVCTQGTVGLDVCGNLKCVFHLARHGDIGHLAAATEESPRSRLRIPQCAHCGPVSSASVQVFLFDFASHPCQPEQLVLYQLPDRLITIRDSFNLYADRGRLLSASGISNLNW